MPELSDPLAKIPHNYQARHGRIACGLVDRMAALDPRIEKWADVAEARQWAARAAEIETEAAQLGDPVLTNQLEASTAVTYANGTTDLADLVSVARRSGKPDPAARRLVDAAVRNAYAWAWGACRRPGDRWVIEVLRPAFETAAEPLPMLARRIPADWVDGAPGHQFGGSASARALDVNAARLAEVLGRLDELWQLADELRSQRLVRVVDPVTAHEWRWERPHLAPIRVGAPGWALLQGYRANAGPAVRTWAEVKARDPEREREPQDAA